MNLKTTFSSILIIISLNVLGQGKEQDTRLQVLKYNRIGREFVFKTEDKSTTRLTYLGTIHSKKGVDYKIVNSILIWGQSHRATNRILVFDKTNKYLGNYPLTLTSDLPSSIQNNNLLFNNKSGSDCDSKLITYLNFDAGIPKEFFRKCAGKSGDIYTFNKD
jgi:hypothetical protein